jgi:hypothetical protein
MNVILALHCFPFLARQNPGVEEGILNLRTFMGVLVTVFWFLAGYIGLRIDGKIIHHCS